MFRCISVLQPPTGACSISLPSIELRASTRTAGHSTTDSDWQWHMLCGDAEIGAAIVSVTSVAEVQRAWGSLVRDRRAVARVGPVGVTSSVGGEQPVSARAVERGIQ